MRHPNHKTVISPERRRGVGRRAWTAVGCALVSILIYRTVQAVRLDYLNHRLVQAADRRDLPAIRALICAGADPNARLPLSEDDRFPYSLLRLLRGRSVGEDEPVRHSAWTIVTSPKSVPNTSIQIVPPDDPDLLTFLLDNGADPEAVDVNGETALLRMAEYGNNVSCLVVLRRGANPNHIAPGCSPGTALTLAVHCRNKQAVPLLLAYGANPNLPDRTSWTPLHYAAESGSVAVIRALLAHGAGTDVRDSDGYTPIMRAKEDGNTAALRLLRGTVPRSTQAGGPRSVRHD